MNFTFIENLVVKYLEAHPEVIEKLINDLFGALIKKIEDSVAQAKSGQ